MTRNLKTSENPPGIIVVDGMPRRPSQQDQLQPQINSITTATTEISPLSTQRPAQLIVNGGRQTSGVTSIITPPPHHSSAASPNSAPTPVPHPNVAELAGLEAGARNISMDEKVAAKSRPPPFSDPALVDAPPPSYESVTSSTPRWQPDDASAIGDSASVVSGCTICQHDCPGCQAECLCPTCREQTMATPRQPSAVGSQHACALSTMANEQHRGTHADPQKGRKGKARRNSDSSYSSSSSESENDGDSDYSYDPDNRPRQPNEYSLKALEACSDRSPILQQLLQNLVLSLNTYRQAQCGKKVVRSAQKALTSHLYLQTLSQRQQQQQQSPSMTDTKHASSATTDINTHAGMKPTLDRRQQKAIWREVSSLHYEVNDLLRDARTDVKSARKARRSQRKQERTQRRQDKRTERANKRSALLGRMIL